MLVRRINSDFRIDRSGVIGGGREASHVPQTISTCLWASGGGSAESPASEPKNVGRVVGTIARLYGKYRTGPAYRDALHPLPAGRGLRGGARHPPPRGGPLDTAHACGVQAPSHAPGPCGGRHGEYLPGRGPPGPPHTENRHGHPPGATAPTPGDPGPVSSCIRTAAADVSCPHVYVSPALPLGERHG